MSRVGKVPVTIPKDVKLSMSASEIQVEGARGKLAVVIPQGIKVGQDADKVTFDRLSNTKQGRANHGTVRALLANMITGVTKGHRKELEIQGLGFRANLQGQRIVFSLGFSHPVEFEVPNDVKIQVPTQTSIIIEGADKMRVGQVAAKIRSLKPVEPYKGKGIRYVGEIVRRKQGKSVTK